MRDVWKRSESVTIVTQSTPNYVTALDGLLQRWSGPVSVAIFLCIKDIPEVLASLFKYRNMMISFHFVAFDWDKETSNICELMMTTKTDFINQRDVGVSYPYNVLRNVALSAVKSGYIFMIDIDMLTSVNLHDNFLSHIGTISNNIKMTSNNSFSITRAEYMMKFRTAYVIPSFESQSPLYDVKHKYELLPLVGEGFVRPYASASCKHCQKNTNYKKWLSYSEHGAYDIPMSPYHYEPFFILHKSSYPSFNELFKDRGLNRVSQVCETYMSGVNFRVLNSGFLLHRGFRPRRIKDYEKKNYLIYNNMKKTLKLKYDTSRECDVIANYSRIQTTTTKPVLAKPN
ncbi:hypothetical protein FSP39_017070 [Pinctada imbricata]|uniref:Beta-1,4-glucuronyltransferase 1 n=1 Tax=Pinctada imbricata TaxID=66713 RepID=A0AA88YTY6_PINIB|nr:hypothetical protein FSP39_017070 [Pinctada imbricata]